MHRQGAGGAQPDLRTPSATSNSDSRLGSGTLDMVSPRAIVVKPASYG